MASNTTTTESTKTTTAVTPPTVPSQATTATTTASVNSNANNNKGMELRSGRVAGQGAPPPDQVPGNPVPGNGVPPPQDGSRPQQAEETALMLDVTTPAGLPLPSHLYGLGTVRAMAREKARRAPLTVQQVGSSGMMIRFDEADVAATAQREFAQLGAWMGTPVRVGSILLTTGEADMVGELALGAPGPFPAATFNPSVPPPGWKPPSAQAPTSGQGSSTTVGAAGGTPGHPQSGVAGQGTTVRPQPSASNTESDGPPTPRSSATMMNDDLDWSAPSMPALRRRQREFGYIHAKPVGRPETFRGETGPGQQTYADWRFAIETLTTGFTEEVVRQQILATVAGTPMSILRRMGDRATVEEMLEALDVAYGQVSSHDALQNRLYNTRQERNEDVASFNARVSLAVDAIETQYPELMDPKKAAITARDRFFNGLRPELRNALRAKYEDSSQSYMMLLRSARAIEHERASDPPPAPPGRTPHWRGSAKSAQPAPAPASAEEETPGTTTMAAKVAQLETRLSRFEGSRSRSPGPRERSRSRDPAREARRERIMAQTGGEGCFRCGITGHLARDCDATTDFEGKTLPVRPGTPGNEGAGRDGGTPSPAPPTTA